MLIRAMRRFWLGGRVVEPGEIVDADRAADILGTGRAERVSDDDSPRGPMTTITAEALAPRPTKGRKANVTS